jgi:hypothetical protein
VSLYIKWYGILFFWVGEGSIWLRVKVCGAWMRIWVVEGVTLAKGQGMCGMGWVFRWVRDQFGYRSRRKGLRTRF